MPHQIDQLLQRIKELEEEVEFLSMSPSYQVLTRGAIERKWSTIDKYGKSMILFDIDHLHHLNETFGHDEMNRKIKLGLDCVRSSELLGLVFSGDEFVIIVPNVDAELASSRIRESFGNYGITLTIAVAKIKTTDFQSNYQALLKQVTENKVNSMRNSVTFIK